MTPEQLKYYKEKLGMEISRESHGMGLLSGIAAFGKTFPERRRHSAGLSVNPALQMNWEGRRNRHSNGETPDGGTFEKSYNYGYKKGGSSSRKKSCT